MDGDLQRPDPPGLHAVPEELHRRLPVAADARAKRRQLSIKELERCVKELGFVGCNLNPDPSGGYFNAPPLTDKYWYPFYEKMIELDVPAMIHVSGCCNPAQHTTGSYYLNADTMAVMQLILSDVFKDFPKLKLIVPHGGGAVPYHWGRFRGIALDNKRPELAEIMGSNIFFDTCVYHQPGIDLLTKVVPVDNILFASEMVGAVKGIDPKTGFNFDDTKRYVDNTPNLSAADKQKVFEGNALQGLSAAQGPDREAGARERVRCFRDVPAPPRTHARSKWAPAPATSGRGEARIVAIERDPLAAPFDRERRKPGVG